MENSITIDEIRLADGRIFVKQRELNPLGAMVSARDLNGADRTFDADYLFSGKKVK